MKLGIIGAANIAEQALIEPARAIDGVEVWSVAARDSGRASAYAHKHGIPHVRPSYQALIEDSDIDAVYVPLANSLHAHWATAALDAGKHVLCEKPLTSNAQQAADVVAVAKRNDRLLVEAFHWRYHPVAERMIELCRAIAPLTEISAQFTTDIPSNNVRYDYALAGGSMMDLGCYCVHMVRTIVGREPTVASANAVEGPPGIDLTMGASLRFSEGLTATVSSSMVGTTSWPEAMTVRARGEKGTMEILNPMAPQWGHRITARFDNGESIDESIDAPTTFEFQLRAFAGMVSGEVPPLTGGLDAINNMQVIDDIYQASGLGKRQ